MMDSENEEARRRPLTADDGLNKPQSPAILSQNGAVRNCPTRRRLIQDITGRMLTAFVAVAAALRNSDLVDVGLNLKNEWNRHRGNLWPRS